MYLCMTSILWKSNTMSESYVYFIFELWRFFRFLVGMYKGYLISPSILLSVNPISVIYRCNGQLKKIANAGTPQTNKWIVRRRFFFENACWKAYQYCSSPSSNFNLVSATNSELTSFLFVRFRLMPCSIGDWHSCPYVEFEAVNAVKYYVKILDHFWRSGHWDIGSCSCFLILTPA